MDFFKDFHKEFAWFIWGLVALGFIWFFMGGANQDTAHEGAYIKAPAPLDSGQVYGNYYSDNTNSHVNETIDLPPTPGEIIKNIESAFQNFWNKTR